MVTVAQGDGNGWVECGCGHRHWGLNGAAGLALVRPAPALGEQQQAGDPEVLLQLRSGWTHQGGTWGFPGGARDSHESAAVAALREADEEVGLDPDHVDVVTELVTTEHDLWSYSVVVATPARAVAPRAANSESDAVAWFPLASVAGAPLHPALAATWQRLAPVLAGAFTPPAQPPPDDLP